MRVISKFKDYYDSAMGWGVDRSLVYVRNCNQYEFDPDAPKKDARKDGEWVEFKGYPYKRDKCFSASDTIHDIGRSCSVFYYQKANDRIAKKTITIGFCGKLYNCQVLIFNPDKVKKKIDFKYEKPKEHNLRYDGPWLEGKEDFDIFHELGVPCFVEYGGKIILNPPLKSVKFYRVFDPYSAYQELSMFVGGVMRKQEKDTVEISDKDLRDAKGFNKWSFRRLPESQRG